MKSIPGWKQFLLCLLFSPFPFLQAQQVDAFLDNGVVHVGVSRFYGGAISWLSTHGGSNLVNVADKGRLIQQSYYAGKSVTTSNQCPSWSPWPWNPIQGGACGNFPSEVLELRQTNSSIYIKTLPKLWDRKNLTAQCYFEQWMRFHPSFPNVVVVDNRFTSLRDLNDEWGKPVLRDQEIPACYFVTCLGVIKSYTGSSPWENQPLSVIPNTPPPWSRFTPTEKWAACVNTSDWGVGVYCPATLSANAGKAGTETTYNPNSGSTMHIALLDQQAFTHTSIYTYRYYLSVGSIGEIRSNFYQVRTNPGPPQIP